jgi:hypothetical protein
VARRQRHFGLFAVLAFGLIGSGCGDDAQIVARQVRDFISNVSSPDGQATSALVQGAPPESSGGPDAAVELGSATLIMGGGALATVSSDVEFGRILLYVAGATDYYELILPAPTGEADVVVALSQNVPESSFTFRYAVVTTGGAVGNWVGLPVSVQSVEAGDVQVSLSWGTSADLNLYVTDPSGATVSTFNPSVPSGGTLDLDANAGCTPTAVTAENISWPSGGSGGTGSNAPATGEDTQAPSERENGAGLGGRAQAQSLGAPTGMYEARVELYAACGAASTKFVLTIQRRGADPLVRVGSFSGEEVEPFVVPFTFPASGVDVPQTRCGDGVCSGDETAETCSEDCRATDVEPTTCGNGTCEAELGETVNTCPEDCRSGGVVVCGDEVCHATESCSSCPDDCGPCSETCDVTGSWSGSWAIGEFAGGTVVGYLVQEGVSQLTGHFTASMTSCAMGELCACIPSELGDSVTGVVEGTFIQFGYATNHELQFDGSIQAGCSAMGGQLVAIAPEDSPEICMQAGGRVTGTWTMTRQVE